MATRVSPVVFALPLALSACPAFMSDNFRFGEDGGGGTDATEEQVTTGGSSSGSDAMTIEPTDGQGPADGSSSGTSSGMLDASRADAHDAATDACVSEPTWCNTHCGPQKDNCGTAVSCPSCPAEAGCGMGTCDSGTQCCTGYCGASGTCVSTCIISSGSCILSACCYGLTCTVGFPPVIHTCK
jgi:hypothetical protein